MHIIASLVAITFILALTYAHHDYVHDDTRINEINNKRSGWRAGRNPRFANVTLEDAAKLLGLSETPDTNVRSVAYAKRLISADTLPEEFDARTKWSQCVMPIRDQQTCGGCWAFAASTMFGMRQCIQTSGSLKVDMAPQYPISCDSGNNGCNGGSISGVWSFFQNSGHVADVDYPYTSGRGSTGTCSLKSGAKKYYASSSKRLMSVAEMQQEIYANGPIQVGFDIYQDFYNYKSGVYTRTSSSKVGGHSVVFVGWGKDGYGTPYWIAINSWGSSWGMSGIFYIRRGTNECNIETGYRPYAGTIRVDGTISTTAAPSTTTTTTTRAATTTTTRAPATTTTTRAPAPATSTTRAPATTTTTTTRAPAPATSTTAAPTASTCPPIPSNCPCGIVLPAGATCKRCKINCTSSTAIPTSDCWTCAPGWIHWYELGWSKPSNGDRCQCVRK